MSKLPVNISGCRGLSRMPRSSPTPRPHCRRRCRRCACSALTKSAAGSRDGHKTRTPGDGLWWLTGIVDAAGTGGLLGHVEGRTSALVAAWIKAQPQDWRNGISHVTIDLSAPYAKVVTTALPGAVIVADRFHLIARRLLTGHENLTTKSFTRMWNALADTGQPGLEVLHGLHRQRRPTLLARVGRDHPGS